MSKDSTLEEEEKTPPSQHVSEDDNRESDVFIKNNEDDNSFSGNHPNTISKQMSDETFKSNTLEKEKKILPSQHTSEDDDNSFSGSPPNVVLERSVLGRSVLRRSVAIVTNEDGEEYVRLDFPEDSFSFFALGHILSLPCLLSFVILLIQLSVYTLALFDLLEDSEQYNPLNVPVHLEIQVILAQFMAILITVMTIIPDGINVALYFSVRDESELILPPRFREDKIRESLYSTTRCDLFATAMFYIVQMVGSVTASFVLIVQSDRVIELLFNFAALNFVVYLDELAFVIARDGFFGYDTSLAEMAHSVQDSKVQVPRKRVMKALWVGRLCALLLFGCMTSVWGVIIKNQADGKYDCNSLQIQIGDDFVETCGLLSGSYDFDGRDLSGYPKYKNPDAETELTYDEITKSWRIVGTRCIVYSSEIEEYDILNVPGSVTWNVYDNFEWIPGGIIDHFSLTCNDCDRQADGVDAEGDQWYQGQCNSKGKCKGKKCECNDSYEGPLCGLNSPAKWCEFLVVDDDPLNETSWLNKDSDDEQYIIMREPRANSAPEYIKMFDRPVYFGYTKSVFGNVIMFLGRRYIVGNVTNFFPGVSSYRDLAQFLSSKSSSAELIWGPDRNHSFEQAHSYAQTIFDGIEFISEPVDVGTIQFFTQDNVAWHGPPDGDYWLGLRPNNEKYNSFICIPHCDFSNFADDPWNDNVFVNYVNDACYVDQLRGAYDNVYSWLMSKNNLQWKDDK